MTAATLLPLFEQIQSSPVGQTIRHSAALIALLEIVHLIGLTLLLGTILMVDLSLLGYGIGSQSTARVALGLRNWTTAGLWVLLATGPLIFISEAVKCYKSPVFWIKMALLVLAIWFHFTTHRRTALADPPPPDAKGVAILSLVLWFGVALAAKAIAIFPPPGGG